MTVGVFVPRTIAGNNFNSIKPSINESFIICNNFFPDIYFLSGILPEGKRYGIIYFRSSGNQYRHRSEFSYFADRRYYSVELIPLETSNQCMIGHIDKIIYKNSKYYLLDRRQSKSIFRFDWTGRFEGKIGHIGRGPGEYIEPTDFIVNHTGIIVLNQYTRRLLFYTPAGKIISKGIHNRYSMNYSSGYSCQQSANGILYHKSLRSTIY